jgi:hypothetical protein
MENSLRPHEPAVMLECLPKRRVGFRRIDQRFRETSLVLNGQANDLRLLDRAMRGFLRGSYDKIADAAALKFGRAFHDGKRIGRNARFKPGRPVGFLGHRGTSLSGMLYVK